MDAWNLAMKDTVKSTDASDGMISPPSTSSRHLPPPPLSPSLSLEEFASEFQEMKREFKKLQKDFEETKDELEATKRVLESMAGKESAELKWKRVLGPSDAVNGGNHTSVFVPHREVSETKIIKLQEDVNSILACYKWNTAQFWVSLLVNFGIQVTLIAMLLVDTLSLGTDNPLNLPENVEITVRIAQVIAIMIALFVMEDIRDGLQGIFRGRPTHVKSEDPALEQINSFQWTVVYTLRFSIGFLVLFLAFLLIIQSEDVISLTLNFMGIVYISDLDNQAFELAAQGYLGGRMRDCAKHISEAEFYNDIRTETQEKLFSRAWFRRRLNVLTLFVLLIGMLVCYFLVRQ